MKIRDLNSNDVGAMEIIFSQSQLPPECRPDTSDPLFLVKRVVEDEKGRVGMIAAAKVTSEVWLLVDHSWGTAKQRWELLQNLTQDVASEAKRKGLDQLTCFVPASVAKSFAKRLQALGFVKGSFIPFSLNL